MPSSRTPALQPARNIDPNPAKGGGDITIVGGVALLPESGPQGTMADIENHAPESDQISIYVVRNGDSLSGIGKLFGVSANTILWANDLKSVKDIHPGDTLVILPVTGVRYTVLKGDTLPKIAKKFGADQEEIAAFNNIQGLLAVGTEIIIPDGVETPAAPPSSGTTARVIRSAGGPLISGFFMRPMIGGIKTQGLHGYNGIDIGAPVGTQVLASAAGTVMIARDSGWNGGYGQYVVMQHANGTQTVYGHLSQVYVSAGATIPQGQVIGLSGRSGKSTGPHLHFEIRGAANPF